MAENNSSAPLLPCPFCGGEADIQSGARGMWNIAGCKDAKCGGFRASGWHNSPNEASIGWNTRAPQAQAAQAPAAMAVPTHSVFALCESVERQNSGETEFERGMRTAARRIRKEVAVDGCTPELPATEYSSAGDLAEVSHQTKLLAQALGDCIIASGIVRSDLEMSGPQLLMFAEDLKEQLLARQAEVQAEPVAWADWKVGSTSYAPHRTRQQAEASVSQSEIAATQEGPYEVVPLYTAPQAQPADALDAVRHRQGVRKMQATSASQARKDGVDAADALHALAVDHGADRAQAAGLAHHINGAFVLLEGQIHDGLQRESALDAAMAAAQEGGAA